MTFFHVLRHGYNYYWKSKFNIDVTEYRRIYKKVNGYDYLTKWDVFYLELSLSVLKCHFFYFFIIWSREYLFNLIQSFSIYRHIYFTDELFDSDKSYIILFENRVDLSQQIKSNYIFSKSKQVILEKKVILINPILNILKSFSQVSIENIFRYRINKIYFNFNFNNNQSNIYLYEGRSSNYRSLYNHLKTNFPKSNISFFWLKPSSLCYEREYLSSNSNLDYPAELIRPKLELETIVVILKDKIKFEEPLLIVLPTFNNHGDIIKWINNIKSIFIAPRYHYSFHPTAHEGLIINLDTNECIDYDKNNYINKYNYFVGYDSTFLFYASRCNKNVYSTAFSPTDLFYLKESTDLKSIYYKCI